MAQKLNKFISFFLCFLLVFEQCGPLGGRQAFSHPAPGAGAGTTAGRIDLSGCLTGLQNAFAPDVFRPLHLRYLSYNPKDNNFHLFLDKGDIKDPTLQKIEDTTKILMKYFFIGLTLPNDSFWVNLRPDSPDNIIDDSLAKTDIGRIMLETDLQLKKDTAWATSPQTAEGKEYWDKLYQKAVEIFGSQNITIPTLTRPWIVPDEIIIRETKDSAYIYKATLKIMLEQDYLKNSTVYNFKDDRLKELNKYSSQLIREIIIPKLTQEINSSKRYASLRQVYYSLIMAQWFKARFCNKGGLYSRIIDKKVVFPALYSKESWSKTTYFHSYQKYFKDGEYNIHEPAYSVYGQVIRSYFSGGEKVLLRMPQFGQAVVNNTTGSTISSIPTDALPAIDPNVVVAVKVKALDEPGELGNVQIEDKIPVSQIKTTRTHAAMVAAGYVSSGHIHTGIDNSLRDGSGGLANHGNNVKQPAVSSPIKTLKRDSIIYGYCDSGTGKIVIDIDKAKDAFKNMAPELSALDNYKVTGFIHCHELFHQLVDKAKILPPEQEEQTLADIFAKKALGLGLTQQEALLFESFAVNLRNDAIRNQLNLTYESPEFLLNLSRLGIDIYNIESRTIDELPEGAKAMARESPAQAMPSAAISYLIADLKLTKEGRVKILEFGDGIGSDFEGYDAVNEGRGLMMSLFWNYLSSLNLPVWYVVDDMSVALGSEYFVQHRATGVLESIRDGHFVPSIRFVADLKKGRIGKRKANFNPRDLSTYSAILLFTVSHQYTYDQMKVILRDYPWIIWLNSSGAVGFYVQDKFLTNTLFDTKLAEHRPGWKMLIKQYRSDLSAEIMRDLPAERYVIKPLDANRGRGILVVDKEALDAVLKRILNTDNEKAAKEIQLEQVRVLDGENDPFEYWLIDRNPAFLIETCETSKPVNVRGKQFDGTLRMAFCLRYSQGAITVDFLDGYWKLPVAPIGQGDLQDSVISKIHREKGDAMLDAENISAKVSDEDKITVMGQLKDILPQIFTKMLSVSDDTVIGQLLSSNNRDYVAHGIYSLAGGSETLSPFSSRLIAIAQQKDGFFDEFLAGLIKSIGNWEENSELIPLAEELATSEVPQVREDVLKIALENENIPRFKSIALQFRDRSVEIRDLEFRAEYLYFLRKEGEIDSAALSAGYETIFGKGDYDSQKFMLRDMLNKKNIFKSSWIWRYLQDEKSLLFAFWINLFETNRAQLENEADSNNAMSVFTKYAKFISRISNDQAVRLLWVVAFHQKKGLTEWYMKLIRRLDDSPAEVEFSVFAKKVRNISGDFGVAGRDLFVGFKAIQAACREYFSGRNEDPPNLPPNSGLDTPGPKSRNPGPSSAGGIDFRSLPIVTHAINNLNADIGNPFINRLSNLNLNSEWREIENLINSGIIPSTERIKEYVQASCYKGSLDKDKVISCISDILRIEEERYSPTDPILHDILVVLDSSNSLQSLKAVFSGAAP